MNAAKTANPIGESRKTGAQQRPTSHRTVLVVILGVFQVIGFLATMACLLLTGPSVWTMLIGLAAAAVTRASLNTMDRPADFGDDADACGELAEFVMDGYKRHNRRLP